VGLQLKDFWTLEEHHLGETTFTHFGEGTAKKNRMQANDFVDSLMYRRGVTCSAATTFTGQVTMPISSSPRSSIVS
jgi:hypothetical protein